MTHWRRETCESSPVTHVCSMLLHNCCANSSLFTTRKQDSRTDDEVETMGYKLLQTIYINPSIIVLDTTIQCTVFHGIQHGRLEVSEALCTQPHRRRHCNVSHHQKCLLRSVLIYTVYALTLWLGLVLVLPTTSTIHIMAWSTGGWPWLSL